VTRLANDQHQHQTKLTSARTCVSANPACRAGFPVTTWRPSGVIRTPMGCNAVVIFVVVVSVVLVMVASTKPYIVHFQHILLQLLQLLQKFLLFVCVERNNFLHLLVEEWDKDGVDSGCILCSKQCTSFAGFEVHKVMLLLLFELVYLLFEGVVPSS
jgi:hypothetical protein